MIRAKITFDNGIVGEGQYNDLDELADHIARWNNDIINLEVDIESSDNYRPAFWREE